MRVWIVSEGEPLPIDAGEVRLRRMGQLSTIMAQQGHEVHWFSSTYHHYKKIDRVTEDKDVQCMENLVFHLLKGMSYEKNVSVRRVIHHHRIAAKFLESSEKYDKPDVILATMAPLELSGVAMEYGKKNGVPVVVDIRDLWPEIYLEVVPRWGASLLRPYVYLLKRRLGRTLRASTALIAVTDGFLDYGLSLAKIKRREQDQVFYTAYRLNDSVDKTRCFREYWMNYGLRQSDFIITFIGNFGKQFVLDPVIEAAKKLREYSDIKFVLCGTGECYHEFSNVAQKLENVVMPGWIDETQICSLLQFSAIGLAPYRDSINFRLNAPNKFGEYLSASLPVLLSIEGVMETLVRENCCGILYKDSLELCEAILTLYNDSSLLKTMSENAYRLYEDSFAAEKVYYKLAAYLAYIAANYKRLDKTVLEP